MLGTDNGPVDGLCRRPGFPFCFLAKTGPSKELCCKLVDIGELPAVDVDVDRSDSRMLSIAASIAIAAASAAPFARLAAAGFEAVGFVEAVRRIFVAAMLSTPPCSHDCRVDGFFAWKPSALFEELLFPKFVISPRARFGIAAIWTCFAFNGIPLFSFARSSPAPGKALDAKLLVDML